jgi:hypothetical protein
VRRIAQQSHEQVMAHRVANLPNNGL